MKKSAYCKCHVTREALWTQKISDGNRAKGNFKKGSDIDLAIMNAGVPANTISRMKGDFEESSLPYIVDVLDYNETRHNEIKEHIDRVGIEFYNTLNK